MASRETYLFRQINRRLGRTPKEAGESFTWFRNTARELGQVTAATPQKVLAAKDIVDISQLTSDVIGAMVCYFYDPKHKKTLPYYDRFPLIFVVDVQKDGWHGLNMHYLPLRERAQLMNALYTLRTNRTVNDKTRLNLTYQGLKNASRLKLFQPCFKKYLFGHVRSKFKLVGPNDWDKILFMPIARFVKASEEKVWSDSLRKAGK